MMLTKDQKEKIFDLLLNHNKLKSYLEFKEIQMLLQYAYQECDFDLIKTLLSESYVDEFKKLIFKIDKTNKTMSLFKVNQQNEELIIPRSITYEFNDYLVTNIIGLNGTYKYDMHVKTVKFDDDSAVSTINGFSFSNTIIEEIYFPKSLNELKERWCFGAYKLKKIIGSPLNNQFLFKD